MTRKHHIALLIEPSTSYGRGILRGVARFARGRRDWAFEFEHAAGSAEMLRHFRSLAGIDGVIARRLSEGLLEQIARDDVPAVRVGAETPEDDLPLAASDNHAIGRLAAEHLLELGFRHLGGVGFPSRPYSVRRMAGCAEVAAARGANWSEYRGDPGAWGGAGVAGRTQLLAPWIESLPTPIGLVACNDEAGRYVLEACRAVGRRAGEEVGVVGVDNDEVLCELSNPPLASVELGAERIGYAAAGMLAALLAGRQPKDRRVRVEPVGVVARASAETIVVADELVRDALRFIRQRATDGIGVEDVIAELGVSRRWLEVRFRRATGGSPAAEIRRVRIERAKRLLAETDVRIPEVAGAAGFHDAKLLIGVFRRTVGTTPTAYRKRFRLR